MVTKSKCCVILFVLVFVNLAFLIDSAKAGEVIIYNYLAGCTAYNKALHYSEGNAQFRGMVFNTLSTDYISYITLRGQSQGSVTAYLRLYKGSPSTSLIHVKTVYFETGSWTLYKTVYLNVTVLPNTIYTYVINKVGGYSDDNYIVLCSTLEGYSYGDVIYNTGWNGDDTVIGNYATDTNWDANAKIVGYVTPPEVTVSCPASSWCYLAQNYSSKTLQQLDDMYSTDTIQGKYNSTSQKYENHRTGYAFNANVQVQQKEGYYIYFSSTQDITMTPGDTPSITLKQGWSLTSNYGTSARTLAELKSSIGSPATQAKYYDKVLKSWVSTDSQSVPAMESFFVYCTSENVWSG